MNVLLVFPGIGESGFNQTGKPLRLVWLHHGLASLASSLKQAGHRVSLIDLRQLGSWGAFTDALKAISPDVVGITMMSVDRGPALEAASIVKSVFPETKVIMGGPHPTLEPDDIAGYAAIDHIVAGEGEITLVQLLAQIARHEPSARLVRGTHPDLDSLPFVDRALFGAGEMPIDHFLRIPFVTIIAGRGCMYNCSFCQPAERIIFGDRVRRRSVANVIAELETIRKAAPFQSLMIHDDCLTEDREWVLDFCAAYRRHGFRQPFVCQSRADIICKNEDMVRAMARAGLVMYLIGFESGNQRVLNFLRKGTTVEQNLRANAICRRYGVRVWANYMFGIPTETKEEALDTLRMIKRIKPYRTSPALFTPHPGSDLYAYCRKHDISLIREYRDYARGRESAKIKGVDYVFLKEVVAASRRMPLSVKVRRKVDHIVHRKIHKHLHKLVSRKGHRA